MTYRLTSSARSDVEEIDEYISSFDPNAALKLLMTFRDRWSLLATQPRSGRPRDEIVVGLRSLAIGNYVTFYYVEGEVVVIARVLHGHRDISDEIIG